MKLASTGMQYITDINHLELQDRLTVICMLMALALAVSRGEGYSKRLGRRHFTTRKLYLKQLINECQVYFDMLVEHNGQGAVVGLWNGAGKWGEAMYGNGVMIDHSTGWFYNNIGTSCSGAYKVARAIVRRAITGGKPAGKRAQLLPTNFIVPAWFTKAAPV
jgi:hypothetical protein